MTHTVRPRLSYVVHSLNPGGTERLVLEMSMAFSEDYDVEVLCLDEPGTWAGELRRCGVAVHSLWRQPGFDISIPVKLARYFRRHRTEIIHAHQYTPWFYAALSRLLHPAPRLLFQEHGRFFPEVQNRVRSVLNRALISRLTHRFVAVSRDIRERLRQYEGLDPAKIDVIYNGVPAARRLQADERDVLRNELGFEREHFVVGTVGRFDPIKNLPMLIESLKSASEDVKSLRGLLVGAGPVFEEMKELTGKVSMRDRIHLTGFRPDARVLTQCLDLFVLSSFSEGTSMALLDAMAAGIPVVVTDVGGNREIVEAQQTGWMVPSGSKEALSQAIVDAATDLGKRARFAHTARKRLEERFSMRRMLESYAVCYRDVLAVES